MVKFYTFIVLFFSAYVQAQVNEDLTPEERAYLFHIVKKSPILDENFGRFFDYTGPQITFTDGTLNYDSVEILIINKPELLVIRKDEIAKSSKGLITEAANKMALWELNKVLMAKRTNPKDLKQYENEYVYFEELLMKGLPVSAQKKIDDKMQPHPKIMNLINPTLSLRDKLALTESMRFLTPADEMCVHKTINKAIDQYVEKRSFEIFKALGGEAEQFNNVIVAAGDGSSTAGLLEEREKDENGRWNRGLPKAVGLFPYQLKTQTIEESGKEVEQIVPFKFTENNFFTAGENQITNVHLDVWGYNAEKQTTVVIERNGLHFHLFGSGETRFLSPDSTFSEGATFMTIIHQMEKKIEDLREMIIGKKGFDHWIDYHTKKKDQTELKIEKVEKQYSDLGYSPITTSPKASRKVKKSKKKAIKNNSSGFDGTPTTNSNKSERKSLQDEIVYLYGKYEAHKAKIKELEEQKLAAIDLLAKYQLRLDEYNRAIGMNWATYEEKDGLYTFQDSSTFDIRTQEFKIPPTESRDQFEVRLIAIPNSALSDMADEVMLHINVLNDAPVYNARIRLEMEDVFESDKFDLPGNLLSHDDSVSVVVFFEGLLEKDLPFDIIARGQGLGKWNGSRTIRDPKRDEIDRYPGTPGYLKTDTTYTRLRRSELFVHMDRAITIEVNSYTDPVKSNLTITNPTILSAMTKYNLTKNDILSAYRTAAIISQFRKECNILAGQYMTREEASKIIDKLNKKIDKVKISVGRTSFKLSDFTE